MANEITAQKITIQKNMGLTQALKAHVLKNNYTMSDGSINAKEWNKTIDVLESINEKRKKAGSTPIFTGGTDRSKAGWHTSFVVHPNQEIEFTKEEMKELYDAMGVTLDNTTTSKTKKNKVEETPDEKEKIKDEKKRIKAEKKAEKKRLKEEKKAEKERIKAEKKAEKERLKAEKKAEKERKKAEKKQNKIDLTHDKAAIDVVVAREQKYRRAAQSKFDKANKVLTNIAYDKENPYIKVDTVKDENGQTYTTKIAKVKERYVKAKYDNRGELVDVEINVDNSKKHYAPDVKYTADIAYADTKEKKPGYEVWIGSGFDFEAIKKVVARIFGRESK